MAKFLTTVANSYNIEEIIKKAKNNLTLVTPYLKLSKNILERILDANDRDVKITLIYGKSELSNSETEKLKLLNNIEVYYLENLHAKCYYNETNMIITSMNLYEFSERNNREMGILIDAKIDNEIFQDTIEEVKSIIKASYRKKEFKKVKKTNNELIIKLKKELTSQPDWSKEGISYTSLLLDFFAEKHPKHKIELNEYGLMIHNFPIKGVFLEAGYSFSFNVPNEELYFLIKEKNRNQIRNELKGIRIFRNKLKVQVYPEINYDPGNDEKGIKNRVEKGIRIINSFEKNWS